MILSTFADETSKDVISADLKRTITLDRRRLTIELTPFCWAHNNKLSIDVHSRLGWGRFVSPKNFKTAKLADLDKLIKRINKVKVCKAPKCKLKYLVHDWLKIKNPSSLCPKHLEKSRKEQINLELKRGQERYKLIEGPEHDKVLSSGGIQEDESSHEAIHFYAKHIQLELEEGPLSDWFAPKERKRDLKAMLSKLKK